MNSKGISPMIAVVLLVAFTVAVGGILSLWLTGYATTTTESVETSTSNQTSCAGTYISVVTANDNAVILTNPGSNTIEDVTCITANGSIVGDIGGGSEDDISSGGTLTTSYWNTTPVSDSTYVSGYGTSITCSGKCRNIGVTGGCKSGQTCWDV